MKRFAAAALFLCLIATSALAFWQSRDSNYNVNIVSGGASPTWAGFGSSVYTGCAFTSPCTFGGGTPTTFAVTSGFMVAVIFADGANSLAASGAVSLGGGCSGSLNRVVEDATSDTNNFPSAIVAGTVTGGSACTISVTAGSGTMAAIGIAYGTLNNLSSTTAGSTCSTYFSGAANPFTCGAALTVSAGGYGIAGGVQHNGNATTWTPVNTMIDSQGTSGTYAVVISHTTSTIGAPGPSFAGFNFGQVVILGAPWR